MFELFNRCSHEERREGGTVGTGVRFDERDGMLVVIQDGMRAMHCEECGDTTYETDTLKEFVIEPKEVNEL